MNTHSDKTQENTSSAHRRKSQSVAIDVFQKKSSAKSTFQFIDHRPEGIAQRKLQKMADNCAQVSHLRAFQEMANNSPQAKQATQFQAMADTHTAQQQPPEVSRETIQKKESNMGLPENLKTGLENLSGYSMDNVKVHRNSDKPAQLNAHAYAQGTDIHLGPGQEKHLPHEAWHVVQQKQGRVKPTFQMKGQVTVNDDVHLEKEADVMGRKAFQFVDKRPETSAQRKLQELAGKSTLAIQLKVIQELVNYRITRQNLPILKPGYRTSLTSLRQKSITGNFPGNSNVLQARFDDEDITKMRQVAAGDEILTNILREVLDIHNQMPDDLNYGVSTKGGHAALNPQGKGQIVVKDERWALTKKIKNYFNAYDMEHDIERQSMIIHELTHLAELYTNLQSNDGVVPEELRPNDDKKLAQAMEPDPDLVDDLYQQKDDVEKLLDDSDYEDKMKTYLRGRLEYGFAINAENPTVFTEISYYLKAKGKSGTPFYNKITEFAGAFYQSRLNRKAKKQDK